MVSFKDQILRKIKLKIAPFFRNLGLTVTDLLWKGKGLFFGTTASKFSHDSESLRL